MCPTDTTPDPRDMLRAPDEPEFRKPRRGGHTPDPDAADIRKRPALPDHPVMTAVDVEDEEADPVGRDQPAPGERLHSDSKLQRG